jgi:hypothetical protein
MVHFSARVVDINNTPPRGNSDASSRQLAEPEISISASWRSGQNCTEARNSNIFMQRHVACPRIQRFITVTPEAQNLTGGFVLAKPKQGVSAVGRVLPIERIDCPPYSGHRHRHARQPPHDPDVPGQFLPIEARWLTLPALEHEPPVSSLSRSRQRHAWSAVWYPPSFAPRRPHSAKSCAAKGVRQVERFERSRRTIPSNFYQ